MPEPVRGAQCQVMGSGLRGGQGPPIGLESRSLALPGQLTLAPGLTFAAVVSEPLAGLRNVWVRCPSPCLARPFSCPSAVGSQEFHAMLHPKPCQTPGIAGRARQLESGQKLENQNRFGNGFWPSFSENWPVPCVVPSPCGGTGGSELKIHC